MDTNSTESPIITTTRSAELLSKRKRKNQRYKANRKERKLSQLKDVEASKTEESSVEDVATSKNFDAQLLPPPGHVEMGTEPANFFFEVNAVGKKKRKKRRKLIDSNLSVDDSVEMKATEVVSSNLPEGSGDKFPHDKLEGAHDSRFPPLGHLDMGTESAKNLSEINGIGKTKWKKRQKLSNSNLSADDSVKMKATEAVSSNVMEVSADKFLVDILEVAHDSRLPPLRKTGQINSNISADDSVKIKATEVVSSNVLEVSADKFPVDKLEVAHDSRLPPLGHLDMGTESAKNLFEINAVGKKKRKKRRKNGQINSNISTDDSVKMKATEVVSSNILEDSTDKFSVDKLEGAHDSRIKEVNTFAQGKKKNSYVEEAKGEANEVSIIANVHPGPCLKRKLLILDVNGLLADIVHPPPRGGNPDTCFWRRAIFKRPFCDDFLNFCFQRFDVAIWSSRSKRIIDRVVDYLLGKRKHKLLFCWDMSHTTQTSFKTLENPYKPLVFKELRKVWDIYDPGLPWKRGDYDESNTLLLDDSPYKALLNPAHTAICPVSYNFRAENDNSLGPGGDLRIYLEELSKSEHIQKYVELHPFGQQRIDATSSDWKFYSGVLSQTTGQSA